jgi:hypothetical protein
MQFDWNALIVALNSAALGYLAYETRRGTNGKLTAAPGQEELWTELNDLRATLNKIVTQINKQLRAQGRTIQAGEVSTPGPLQKRAGGLIIRSNGHTY